ncbi:MAG: hypothetical protein JSR90_05980 [Proteobacteria bacterium]|nr:hypothetical protein [Pseudomonadota bacterium]
MRRIWKCGLCLMGLGIWGTTTLTLTSPADANTFFANQTGRPCSACHNPGQEEKGVQGLNAAGQAFKNCGFKFGCNAGSTSAPQQRTTEHDNGVATFSNNCANGQIRWVVLRPGMNDASRDVALIMDPGSRTKVGVSKGTTWAAACGNAPPNTQQFFWIKLDIAVQ